MWYAGPIREYSTVVKLGDESSQSFCSAEGARRLHPWQPPAAGDDSPAARARNKHSGDGKAATRWPRRQAEDRVAQGQSWHARNDNGASASVGRLRPQFFLFMRSGPPRTRSPIARRSRRLQRRRPVNFDTLLRGQPWSRGLLDLETLLAPLAPGLFDTIAYEGFVSAADIDECLLTDEDYEELGVTDPAIVRNLRDAFRGDAHHGPRAQHRGQLLPIVSTRP